ncbi:MAG: hypothetical protein IRY83_00750 [Chloroflexi bacterium]|nr:hypothetical protein [Chloroflexota bacterium]
MPNPVDPLRQGEVSAALERYRVVAFQTVFPIWDDQVEPRGGGVAFLPLDLSDWPSVIAAIVRRHFHHETVRSAEIGMAMLDPAVLARYCQRFENVFWQGGDAP